MYHGTLTLPQSVWVYDYLSSVDATLIMQAEMIAALSALMSAPWTTRAHSPLSYCG